MQFSQNYTFKRSNGVLKGVGMRTGKSKKTLNKVNIL